MVREFGSVQELAPRANIRVLINGVSPHLQQALVETQQVLWEFTGIADTTVLPLEDDMMVRATTERCTVAEIGPKNNFVRALLPVVREFFPPAAPKIPVKKKPASTPHPFQRLFARVSGKQAKGLL
jgi:Flp pilus assembly CpaE family ATPase